MTEATEFSDTAEYHRATLAEEAPVPRDAIAREAYLIWESLGCPSDQADEHWLLAEARLRSR